MSSVRERMDLILESLSDEARAKASKMEKFRLDHERYKRTSAMQAAKGLLSGPSPPRKNTRGIQILERKVRLIRTGRFTEPLAKNFVLLKLRSYGVRVKWRT